MSLIVVLLASTLYLNFAENPKICSDLNCKIKPAKGDIVACECGVSTCELDCSGDKNCQDIVLYSTATETKVVCPKQDSCKQSSFNIGDFDDLPNSLQEANFDTNNIKCSPNSFTLNCEAESSCKDVNVTATSISKVSITASAKDAFDESLVECTEATDCQLTCSNTVTSCDDAQCNGECKCSGKMCPGWTKPPTPAPIIDVDPVEPAPAPVPAPTPDYITCKPSDIDTNGVCELNNLKGGDEVVVTVNDGVDELVINCKNTQQCKKDSNGPLIIYSAANSTIINCGEKNSDAQESCVDGLFYIGEQDEPPVGYETKQFIPDGSFDKVLLNCYGKQACKEANLTANGKFIKVEVMALGEQSYQDSKTECDVKCVLKCNENEPETCGDPICKLPCEINNMPMREAVQRISAVNIVKGSRGGRVVFDNDEQDCRVDCSGKDQCKRGKEPFQVYSGCNNTVIDCSGYASCKEAEFFVGELVDKLPDGKTVDDFSGVKESLEIICGETGCEKASIITRGKILSIIITGQKQASLKDADVICGSNDCVLNCGQKGSDADSCEDLDIRCNSGCVCNGGSCVDIERSPEGGTRINTPAPTSVTAGPTKEPTSNPTKGTEEPTTTTTTGSPTGEPSPAPTASPIKKPTADPTTPEPSESPTKKPTSEPTRSPTTSDSITYRPNGKSISVCKKNVDICIVDCNNKREQCSGEMKVLSGANVTRLDCNYEDACKGATLYVGSAVTEKILKDLKLNLLPSDFDNKATSVEVNCQAQTGCKEINIQVNQDLTNGVTVLGGANSDTLEKATISVTGTTCSVDCGSDTETPSCKELRLGGTCTCEGDNCRNPARISGITNNPNGNDIIHERHYPTILQIIMMGCIGFGLVCLICFFVYFKFFANQSINHKLLNDDAISHNVYNTFSGNDLEALEMENYLK